MIGLAQIKPEGYACIVTCHSKGYKLPYISNCRGVVVDNQAYTMKEYSRLYVKQQPFYKGAQI